MRQTMAGGYKPGVRRVAGRLSRSVREAEEERRRRRQRDGELKECKRERDDAHKTLNKEQAEFDKQLLALSAGFLGLALAFIKDVVPLPDAIHLWALYAGLVFLGLCVFAVLLSLQFSVTGHFSLREYWEKKQEYHSAPQDQQSKLRDELNTIREQLVKHDNRLKFVNRKVSGGLFSLGVIALVYFVIANVGAAHVRSTVNSATGKAAETMPKPSESKLKSPTPQPQNPSPTQPLVKAPAN